MAAAVVGLTACSPGPVSVAPPRAIQEQLKGPRADAGAPKALSFCYSNYVNSPEQVLTEARKACGAGRIELRDEDTIWNNCPLIQPVRATFYCYPLPPE